MLSGGASRLIFGVRKRDRFWGGDFAQNRKVLAKNTLGFEKKNQNPQFGGKFLGCSFRADSGVVNPRQIWFWIPYPENAMDSRPHFQRMPLITGVTFQPDFGAREIC